MAQIIKFKRCFVLTNKENKISVPLLLVSFFKVRNSEIDGLFRRAVHASASDYITVLAFVFQDVLLMLISLVLMVKTPCQSSGFMVSGCCWTKRFLLFGCPFE